MMRLVLLLAIAALAAGCTAAATTPASRERWAQLPPLPDAEGFAGAFAGVSGGALIVAGGANFPGKKPWDGGRKVWYDSIFVLDRPGGTWTLAGKLPRPLGYGVSATWRDSIVCAGGSDAEGHFAVAFRLHWDGHTIVTAPLPPLPRPIANACGAIAGNRLYVAGGQETPDSPTALPTLYVIDLAAASPAWRELEPCPGGGRILAAAAAHGDDFWLIGGAALSAGDAGKPRRRYLRHVWRYRPGGGWTKMPDLPRPVVAAPSPAPVAGDQIFILGGDDGANVDLKPPAPHPGFSRTILCVDATSGAITEQGEVPAPRVTVPCVRWRDRWVIPSGERVPGVRSPEVWSFEPRIGH
jgi:N-acetylneuraminic acid mutarotase